VILGIIALLLTAFVSASYFDNAAPTVSESDLWISEVEKGEFIRQVRGVGVLAPSEIRWIAANSPGRVERLLVKPGALVNENTVIAELSNPQLRSQLEQARWELDAAEANLLALKAQIQEQSLEQELLITQARMALESAILKEKAEQPLAEKNIISELQFASTQLDTKQSKAVLEIRLQSQKRREELSQAKLSAEEAQVRKYRNMVARFETSSQELKITADINGVLQQISIEVGQRVEIGSNIAQVARPDSLIAELQVQENAVQELQLGFPVSIDTRNGIVAGKVARIDPRVSNGNVQVDVELIEELPAGARPDLSITGNIVVEKIEDALYINRPAGAVAATKSILFALEDGQRIAHARNIQFGKASVSTIQILAGLEIGDQVVISDMSEYQQHNALRIVQ